MKTFLNSADPGSFPNSLLALGTSDQAEEGCWDCDTSVELLTPSASQSPTTVATEHVAALACSQSIQATRAHDTSSAQVCKLPPAFTRPR